MNSEVFLRFLHEEYLNLMDRKKAKEKDEKAVSTSSSCGIPQKHLPRYYGIETEVCFFKRFIIAILKNEVVQVSEDIEVSPAELIAHKATERSRVSPYEPLYPYLDEIIKLLNEDEIAEFFGPAFLHYYRTL